MSFFPKQIFTGFMPLLHTEDVVCAVHSLLPWKKKELHTGEAKTELESQLKEYFHSDSVTCFDSGRSALFGALQALGVKKGDEVLLQAYTCAVVSNAILWTGATPVYVDIDDNFTLSVDDLERNIHSNTKVIIVQHTFGIPAQLEKILALAKKHNLFVIEDCAHVMGGTYQGKLLGTFGDIGLLSFGSEKPISCGRGGALVTMKKDLSDKIQNFEQSLSFVPTPVLQKQLRTFIYFWMFKPLYGIGIGKWALAFLKKFHFLSKIIDEREKQGKNLPFYPSKFSNALAKIALLQFSKLDLMNKKRIERSLEYQSAFAGVLSLPQINESEPIPFLRFPLRIENPKQLLAFAKKRGVILGDWYSSPIAPSDVSGARMGYQENSCKNAEKIANESVNLPTHDSLTDSDITHIIEIVHTYVRQKN